jgi:dihydroorotate dehydrogenase (fumarate)
MSAEATATPSRRLSRGRRLPGSIRQAEAVSAVIGSLNGVTTGGWTRYAKLIEDAGADALELNVYLIPTRTNLTSDGVENTYLEILREVKAQVKIPVAMKLGSFFSALPNMAARLDRAGADALVLFNRFYQPDLDLEELDVVPHLVLSNPNEMRLPLRWIAILYGHVNCSLALTTGVHSPEDAVKAVMARVIANGLGVAGEGIGKIRSW